MRLVALIAAVLVVGTSAVGRWYVLHVVILCLFCRTSDLCPQRNGHVRLNPLHSMLSGSRAGRVEVCVDEQWHSLCARKDGISIWDSHTAEVFCKEWINSNGIENASE